MQVVSVLQALKMIYPTIYVVMLEGALIYLLLIGDLSFKINEFWIGVFFASFAYALSARAVLQGNFFSTKTILSIAIVFRITMWLSYPSLSDDIYRYIWDGHVQLSGINPYMFPPNSNELLDIRNHVFPLVNHPEITTIYPPVSQIFFMFCALIGKNVGILKALLLAIEGVLCFFILKLLTERNIDSRRIILYAWHPLTIVEVAGNGHIDVLGVCLMIGLLLSLEKKRFYVSSIMLALGFLSKIIPILLLPLTAVKVIREKPGRYKTSVFLILFFLTIALFSIPYASAGLKIFSGLLIYAKAWHFNDLIHGLISTTLKNLQIQSNEYPRLICMSLFFSTLFYKLYKESDPLRIAFSILCAFLIFTPTLHPWYLLWIIPFFCVFPTISWITFSCVIFLAYNVLTNYKLSGIWNEESWVLWCEYAPLFLILLWENHSKSRS